MLVHLQPSHWWPLHEKLFCFPELTTPKYSHLSLVEAWLQNNNVNEVFCVNYFSEYNVMYKPILEMFNSATGRAHGPHQINMQMDKILLLTCAHM